MSDAKVVLERFNKVSFIVDVLLVILFFTLGFFGLTLIVPADQVMAMVVQSALTLVGFVYAVASLKAAEYLTGLLRVKLEEAAGAEKSAVEPVKAPTVVSAHANRVIKTTKVVMKEKPVKRGRPATVKKEG